MCEIKRTIVTVASTYPRKNSYKSSANNADSWSEKDEGCGLFVFYIEITGRDIQKIMLSFHFHEMIYVV